MKSIITGMVVAGLMCAGVAMAEDMPAVGKAKCSACHAIEKKVIGPAWRDVSRKYKGDPEGVNLIVMHVINGGEFGWKTGTKMPARGLGANDAEIQKLAAFIISLESQP
jgi:cytochrome c